MAQDAFNELKWRGMVYDYNEGLPELLATQKITAYNGFDASADSLHVGHMVPLLALARLQRFGHHPIALAGGGTTLIGDPSFKANERTLLSYAQIEANVDAIKVMLGRFLDFEVKSNPARLLNNADWLTKLNLIEFLRETGKHFTVNYMMAKDSVKMRLEREEGLSFTEFSYMLLQSYDFLYLYDHVGCVLQTGGSDQWGNITAGAELIRRTRGGQAYSLVYPLITKSDGTKFGKTESGAVWLSADRTSPYKFYQFWLNTNDRDVINYLKYFTFLPQEEILSLEYSQANHPEQREAHRMLARVMTRLLHDETALQRSEQAAQVLFGGELNGLRAADIEEIFSDVPSARLEKARLEGAGLNVIDLLVSSGVAKSRGEARRSIDEGGISVNNQRVSDSARFVSLNDAIDGQFLVLRKGRKNYHLVRIEG
ncbi:tyrosine--tRNA ligase [bacterium]|nr:MAG: tyrosine--tRNA ligase [bacterium]